MKRLLALLLAMSVLLLVAAKGGPSRKGYLRAYEGQTRELILYSGFHTALILRGTLLTLPFRMEMAQERQRLVAPPADDQERFVADMREEASAYHEVVFSADTPMESGRVLFGEGGASWLIHLEADGTREELVTAFRVERPNPLQRNLFPHHNQWSELWIARFRRTVQDPGRVVLHVGSGWGNGDLVWEDLHTDR